MKKLLSILLLIPALLAAQDPFVFTIPNEVESQSIKIDSIWNYKVGDEMAWANPEYDDSSWEKIDLSGRIDLYKVEGIPKKLDIIWLRIRVKAQTALHDSLTLRISQTGASEIYLDGQLIHRFGKVSSNPDSFVFYDPGIDLHPIPMDRNNEHLLAIRFANKPYRFPIYSTAAKKSSLSVAILARSFGWNDPVVQYNLSYIQFSLLEAGVAVALTILFMSLYFFFPRQKINLYFALCVFFYGVQMIAIQTGYRNLHDDIFFNRQMAILISSNLYALFGLYCAYLMFKRKQGIFFYILIIADLLLIPIGFLYEPWLLSNIMGVVILISGLRLSIKNINIIKGAEIILVLWGLSALYFIISTASAFSGFVIPYQLQLTLIAQLLIPLSIAIYLGYSFGLTSQSLRQKLKEVEQLSSEKQQILTNQKNELEIQVAQRTADLNNSLEELKLTQTQLIQSEKMASLGELTAGIAHEIQNPLNFVNNFSEVNTELVDEASQEIENGNISEVKTILNDIKENEQKINHHGKRADAIVKGMLEHSRSSSGVKEPTDLNALCDEYLRLAYHGLRAKDKSFNATMKTDFDESIGYVNVVPQDIGRVVLNLINNAFYAVKEKAKQNIAGYEAKVTVSTKKLDARPDDPVGRGKVEISVEDNGNGIPHFIKEKIFQPFFTTKPTGSGTGLGLSLSYDIVKAHGGNIQVETKENKGTEFIIQLPV